MGGGTENPLKGFCQDFSKKSCGARGEGWRDDLNLRLLAAHAAGEKAALVTLYGEAAEGADDIDAACFFLTHAYVYALDIGDDRARTLHARLFQHGREE